MTDAKFYAEIAKICEWLKANRLEATTRHLRRHFPEVEIRLRRKKKSKLTGEAR